jgi:hypothetical protein
MYIQYLQGLSESRLGTPDYALSTAAHFTIVLPLELLYTCSPPTFFVNTFVYMLKVSKNHGFVSLNAYFIHQ